MGCASVARENAAPEEARMPFATVGDVTINYTVQGAGDWVVLIGGYASGNWQAWGAHLTELAKSYKVLALDNRGIGESDVPDYPY